MSNEERIFTPVLKSTGQRLYIRSPIFEEGFDNRRGLHRMGTVQDLETGKRYAITGKACSLPNCKCDAWAEEISD